MTFVYKEHEIKKNMIQQQCLQLKMQFALGDYLLATWKLLFDCQEWNFVLGGENTWVDSLQNLLPSMKNTNYIDSTSHKNPKNMSYIYNFKKTEFTIEKILHTT